MVNCMMARLESEVWSHIESQGSPSGRAGHLMAVDDASERLLLYGGYCGNGGLTVLSDYFELTFSTRKDALSVLLRQRI